MYLGTPQYVAPVLDLIVDKGVIAQIERKHMKNTEKIIAFIESQTDPVTLKQIQDATELPPGIISGTLVSLCKSGRLVREKIERQSNVGPKKPWAYKIVVASAQQS